MDELISRQATIDEGMSYINGDCFCDKEDFAKYIEFIEQLPPIQLVIVRCKECKHRYVEGDSVRYNTCELNHNNVQSDEWFCADAERREVNHDRND